MHASSDYRGDIDGLRAVAVVAVILFHAGLGVPGGFVGVDVFFVISGFLITRLITADLDRGTFSVAGFYDRRIRRIWPASLAVTIAVLVVGWRLMLPTDYRLLSNDALANVALVANIRFLQAADYFAPSSDLRPLLHTWSLAVEEQFYLFFPFVMMLAWRIGRQWCVCFLSLLAVASLVASVLLVERQPAWAFYLLPCRAWELLLGALLALAPLQWLARVSWAGESLSILGMALIAVPCVMYSNQMSFPGLTALPPCLGTVAVIAAGAHPRQSTLSRLLAASPLRTVGLMSYSLYLWHWPVLAYLRYCVGHELPPWILVPAFIAIAIGSYGSWRFIETPFRLRSAAPSLLRSVAVAGCVSVTVAVLCLFIRRTDGVPARFDPNVLALLEPFSVDWDYDRRPVGTDGTTFPPIGVPMSGERPCLLVWGDSHAMAVSPAVDRVARELGLSGFAALRASAVPLPGVWQPNMTPGAVGRQVAQDWCGKVQAWIREVRPRHVIICARWSMYIAGKQPVSGDRHLLAALDAESATHEQAPVVARQGLRELVQVCEENDADVWLFLEVPYQPFSARQRVGAAHWLGGSQAFMGVDSGTHVRRQQTVLETLTATRHSRVHVVDLAAPFFDEEGISYVGRAGRLWYADNTHVTPSGAQEVLEPLFRDILSKMVAGCAEKGENSRPLHPQDTRDVD
jgi:peptidoglycan/LPS O-acetylase OafA/YrhL